MRHHSPTVPCPSLGRRIRSSNGSPLATALLFLLTGLILPRPRTCARVHLMTVVVSFARSLTPPSPLQSWVRHSVLPPTFPLPRRPHQLLRRRRSELAVSAGRHACPWPRTTTPVPARRRRPRFAGRTPARAAHRCGVPDVEAPPTAALFASAYATASPGGSAASAPATSTVSACTGGPGTSGGADLGQAFALAPDFFLALPLHRMFYYPFTSCRL